MYVMLIELLVYVLLILIQMIMNKKFSTLVAGLALCTAFTANAKVENGKVYQLTNEDGKYLSVTESYTKTDSLILADAPTADIKNTDYQNPYGK